MHAERVPPARPFDEAAAGAAGNGLAGWVAGCTGTVPPRVVVSVVEAGARAGCAMPSVGHVAAAVDDGRARAAVAAGAGATVLVVAGGGAGDGGGRGVAAARVAAWLGGERGESRGPLGALWRLGDEELAVLCGAALGAGEHGFALVCEGATATVATALALAIQPALRPRVRAVGPEATAFALPRVLHAGEGAGVDAAVAALRRACGG